MTQTFTVKKTAAVTVVGYNMFTDENWKTSGQTRKINTIAIVGSTAVADCEFELKVGEKLLGTFINTKAGAAVAPVFEDFISVNGWAGKGMQISLTCTDAANANDVIVQIKMTNQTRRYSGRRSYNRRRRTYRRRY